MASISEQRLKEMEAEMNRFEQEIAPIEEEESLSKKSHFIIGARTFSNVQEQLRQIRNEASRKIHGSMPPPPQPPSSILSVRKVVTSESASSVFPLPTVLPPPPPPPSEQASRTNKHDLSPLLPPPPPPPLLNRPAFIPPQLRHRTQTPLPRPGLTPVSQQVQHSQPTAFVQGTVLHGHSGSNAVGHMDVSPYLPTSMIGSRLVAPRPLLHGMMQMRPNQLYLQSNLPLAAAIATVASSASNKDAESSPRSSDSAAVCDQTSSLTKPKLTYSAPPMMNTSRKESSDNSALCDSNHVEEHPSHVPNSGNGMGMEVKDGRVNDDPTPITDMELDTEVSAGVRKERKERKKKFVRTAANSVWEDTTLADWQTDDFRMFCGDLGNEVTDDTLQRSFAKYPSFVKAKVVRDRRTNKSKGYGFLSFKDPVDFTRAMREMNGKYVGNRPIKLRKSTWKDRSIDVVRKKDKEKKRLGLK